MKASLVVPESWQPVTGGLFFWQGARFVVTSRPKIPMSKGEAAGLVKVNVWRKGRSEDVFVCSWEMEEGVF